MGQAPQARRGEGSRLACRSFETGVAREQILSRLLVKSASTGVHPSGPDLIERGGGGEMGGGCGSSVAGGDVEGGLRVQLGMGLGVLRASGLAEGVLARGGGELPRGDRAPGFDQRPLPAWMSRGGSLGDELR